MLVNAIEEELNPGIKTLILISFNSFENSYHTFV